MIDLTDAERTALLQAMKRMAEVMEEIGWEVRLVDLTAEQAFTLAEVAVGGFQDAMARFADAQADPHPDCPF